MLYQFTEKNDLDKLETYINSLLHMLANKPMETPIETPTQMVVDSKNIFINVILIKVEARVKWCRKQRKRPKKAKSTKVYHLKFQNCFKTFSY
jgi:hypothetical protein